MLSCQVGAWQSAILLPIPAWVEEPVSVVRQSSSGGVTNNPPFLKMPYKPARESRLSKLVVYTTSAYSAEGGEHKQQNIQLNWDRSKGKESSD